MKTVPSQIASLFERNAALSGFSVRGLDEIPDSCPRSGDDSELFVGDIGISPAINAEQYAEIFQEVVATLAEVLSEEPEAAESLRGRTFARVLH
jgi:phosphotransacetylase